MQGYTVTPAFGEVFEHVIWQKVMWLKIWLIETSLEIHPFAIVFFIIMYCFFFDILLVQSNRWKWPWHVTASAFDLWMLLNETSIIHHISMNITCLVCLTVNFLLLDPMVINDLDSTPLFHPRFTPSSVWRPGGCNLWRIHENCRIKTWICKVCKVCHLFSDLVVDLKACCWEVTLSSHSAPPWGEGMTGKSGNVQSFRYFAYVEFESVRSVFIAALMLMGGVQTCPASQSPWWMWPCRMESNPGIKHPSKLWIV